MKALIKINILFISFLLFSPYTQAENSKELAMLGKKLWVAFECSALASKSGNPKEQDRLFLYGYETGKKFIESIKKNKIKKEDISSTAPIGVMMLLQGPSTDFMLGRIFGGALENALKDVFITNEKYNSEEIQKIIAENKFQKQNCELIGKL